MTRVPTLAAHTMMATRLMNTQAKIYDLQLQLATEKKSQTYSGISSDAMRLVNFENEMSRTNTYITTNTVAGTRLSAMSSAISGARDSFTTFRDDLTSFLSRDLSSMDDTEISEFEDLQARAFNFMKDMEDYLDLKLDGQYVFSGGKSDVPPVDLGFGSLDAFQEVYDGNDILAPESRFTHMNNTLITSTDTGNLTFTNGTSTITAATAEAFNLQHYDNGDTGNVDFSAANGTITATTAGAFSNVEAGMLIRVGGTATDNDRFYTVKSVSTDGLTITVEPDIATDIAGSATAEISVPAIQPGQITVTGSDNNSRTFTVTDISADGTTLTVTPAPTTEAVAAPSSVTISNDIYYKGGETTVQHRVSETRSIEFGINAKDGAVEKAFRAFGMVLQGMPVDGSGDVDGVELTRRLEKALTIANDALDHETGNTSETNQDFGRLENLLASNQVVINNALTSQKTYTSFLATRTTDMENADLTEVATRINDESTALQVSYAAMNMINQMSLLNFMD